MLTLHKLINRCVKAVGTYNYYIIIYKFKKIGNLYINMIKKQNHRCKLDSYKNANLHSSNFINFSIVLEIKFKQYIMCKHMTKCSEGKLLWHRINLFLQISFLDYLVQVIKYQKLLMKDAETMGKNIKIINKIIHFFSFSYFV